MTVLAWHARSLSSIPTQCGKINHLTRARQLSEAICNLSKFYLPYQDSEDDALTQGSKSRRRKTGQGPAWSILSSWLFCIRTALALSTNKLSSPGPKLPCSGLQHARWRLESGGHVQNPTTGNRMWVWGTRGLFSGRHYDTGQSQEEPRGLWQRMLTQALQ